MSDNKSKKGKANSTLVHAISGLIAGLAAKSIVHPIDTIKAKV